jgi:flagellar assembly protein FliH
MSSTSRVLREDEHGIVQPVWWREGGRSGSPADQRRSYGSTDQRRYTDAGPGTDSEREQFEREAYHRGFAEGKAVGKEQAGAELQPVVERLTKTLADLSSLRSRIRRDAEKDLLKLSITIARRVLHRELTIDPESVEGLIRVALEKLQSRELCRVRVHPDQEPAIRASLERFANSQKIELTPDPSLQCGDVLFETAHGTLDASIDSQLREIERGFADRLHK